MALIPYDSFSSVFAAKIKNVKPAKQQNQQDKYFPMTQLTLTLLPLTFLDEVQIFIFIANKAAGQMYGCLSNSLGCTERYSNTHLVPPEEASFQFIYIYEKRQ